MRRTFTVIFSLLFLVTSSSGALASPDILKIDLSDTKSPILISVEVSAPTFAVGDDIGITLKYRDNKNSMSQSISSSDGGTLWWTSDSPISTLQRDEGLNKFVKSWSLTTQTITQDYVEETLFTTVQAPSAFGKWSLGMVIIRDRVQNASVYNFQNSLWNYRAPQSDIGFAFTPITPLINASFVISQQLTEEKSKAAAERAAAEKAAADKAAADKAMEEQSRIDSRITSAKSTYTKLYSEINSLIRKYPSRKSELDLYLNKIFPFEVINETNIATAELNLAGIASKITSISSTYKKIARTLSCTKGNKTVKVTDVKPACPVGYKVKK